MEPLQQSPPISSDDMRAELQRLIGEASELSSMNQLSHSFLRLLHGAPHKLRAKRRAALTLRPEGKDEATRRVIKEAIMSLAEKAVEANAALEWREAPRPEEPDVACQAIFSVRGAKHEVVLL